MKRVARVELATKVIDNESRLRDTLLHELCHVAAWLLNGCGLAGALKCCMLCLCIQHKKSNNKQTNAHFSTYTGTPHGTHFKYWAAIAIKAYPNMTGFDKCHNYAIHKKWRWRCVNETCGQVVMRHSKSLDVNRVRGVISFTHPLTQSAYSYHLHNA